MINVQKRFFYTDLLKKTLRTCLFQETSQERHNYFQNLGVNFSIQIKIKNELGNDAQL